MPVHYCKDHPDFEGLNQGQLHDHIEKSHKEVQTKEQIAEYFRSKHEVDDFRRSDGIMIAKSWGRPARVANYLGINEIEKR